MPVSLLFRRVSFFLVLLVLNHSHPSSAASRVDTLATAMTLEEKVGQLFMVLVSGPQAVRRSGAAYPDRHVGGFILYSLPGNIESPGSGQAHKRLQAQAAKSSRGSGLLIGVDQEAGPWPGCARGHAFPSQLAQAATGRADLVRLGRHHHRSGTHDPWHQPWISPGGRRQCQSGQPVIGIRSFGSDPAWWPG
jgi:hypothetical protein